MKESAVSQSPFVFDPQKTAAPEKGASPGRLDQTNRAATVIDVLQKVFRRSFADDLLEYLREHPEEFTGPEETWRAVRFRVDELRVIRPESYFFQPASDFRVDILAEGRIEVEEERETIPAAVRRVGMPFRLRLRYSFDLRPHVMTCRFMGAVLSEEDALFTTAPGGVKVDKYLLPAMGEKDYRS